MHHTPQPPPTNSCQRLRSCLQPLRDDQHHHNGLHARQPGPYPKPALNVIPCNRPRHGHNPADQQPRQSAQKDDGPVQPLDDVHPPADDEVVGGLDLQDALVQFLRDPVAPEQLRMLTLLRQMMEEDVGGDRRRPERARVVYLGRSGKHRGFRGSGGSASRVQRTSTKSKLGNGRTCVQTPVYN